jgi:hypothetical protein
MVWHIRGPNVLLADHYPFMMRLVVRYNVKGKIKKAICGGSLISFSHVLTASHCVFGKPLGDFKESDFDQNCNNVDNTFSLFPDFKNICYNFFKPTPTVKHTHK